MRERRVYKALATEPDRPAPEAERVAPLAVDDGLVKSEHRLGDTVAMYIACVCAHSGYHLDFVNRAIR